MKISTKGRYALRVMIDLAEQDSGAYIPLKDIAKRQEISLKYLEGIMTELSKANLVEAMHGKGGGYKLAKDAQDYTVAEILIVEEESLAPVECLSKEHNTCPRANECRTLSMWTGLNKLINDYLNGITLLDLVKQPMIDNYII